MTDDTTAATAVDNSDPLVDMQTTLESVEPVETSKPEPVAESAYDTDDKEAEEKEEPSVIDDYGNDTEAKKESKVYTEEEVNKRINEAVRDRLARLERNQPQQQQQQQQQQQKVADNFQYDEKSDETWQVQLEKFVESTIVKHGQKQAEQIKAQQEQHAMAEFEHKFTQGMTKFKDFVEVVSAQPITDTMTMAARGLNDPASFFYAAAKKAPQELQRIAKLSDPYAQVVEIGRLEERLRKGPKTTNAPKPVSKARDDSGKSPDSKGTSIDDLITQSERQRLERFKRR